MKKWLFWIANGGGTGRGSDHGLTAVIAERWFRKKPVMVAAFRMTADLMHRRELWPQWLKQAHMVEENDHLYIQTLEGWMRVCPGAWVIRGVRGEIYPCNDAVFRESYEECEP
jgi:hypothetical protein